MKEPEKIELGPTRLVVNLPRVSTVEIVAVLAAHSPSTRCSRSESPSCSDTIGLLTEASEDESFDRCTCSSSSGAWARV